MFGASPVNGSGGMQIVHRANTLLDRVVVVFGRLPGADELDLAWWQMHPVNGATLPGSKLTGRQTRGSLWVYSDSGVKDRMPRCLGWQIVEAHGGAKEYQGK